MRADRVQHRLQGPHDLHRRRDVAADIRAEPLEGRQVMVARHGRVQGHDQAVLRRHPRLVEHHRAAQGSAFLEGRLPAQRALVDPGGVGVRQRLGAEVGVAVVGGDRAEALEERAPVLHRGTEAGPGVGRLPRHARQVGDQLGPVLARRLAVLVGTERRAHLAREGRVVADLGVVLEAVARVVGRGDELDVEAVHQSARPELGRRDRGGDRVVDLVGGLRRRAHPDAEDVVQLGLHPELHGGAAVQVPVGAEDPPRVARLLGREVLPPHGDAEVGQVDALAVHDPVHVVVGRQQQVRRVAERDVVGDPHGGHVAVRRQDRQILHLLVQRPSDRADLRVCREEAVWVEGQRHCHGVSLVSRGPGARPVARRCHDRRPTTAHPRASGCN